MPPPQIDVQFNLIVPSHRNVSQLLAWREISPRTKNSRKRLWGEGLGCKADFVGARCATDAKHALMSW